MKILKHYFKQKRKNEEEMKRKEERGRFMGGSRGGERRALAGCLENLRLQESAIHLVKVPDYSVLQVMNNL